MSEEFLEKEQQPERFVRDPVAPTVNTVYLRVKSEQVKGILGSKYAVPAGFMALSKDASGKSKMLFPGEEATGDFTLHLVRDRDVRVPFSVLRAKSKDGFDASVNFELAITPDLTRKESIDAFIERGAQTRRHIDWPLLKGELQPTIANAVIDALKERPAAELSSPDAFEKLREDVIKRAESGLSKLGLTGLQLDLGKVRNDGFEAHQAELAKAGQQVEKVKAEQQVQAAMLKDQMGEELSRKELEEFLASAREEGMLKQHQRAKARIEREAELDQIQAEYKKQRHNLEATLKKLVVEKGLELDEIMLEKHVGVVKRLREDLSDDRVEVYINLLSDEKLKAELLHRLIQRQMSPEQLKALAEIEAAKARQALTAVSQPNIEPLRESPQTEIRSNQSVKISQSEEVQRREARVETDAPHQVGEKTEALGTALTDAVQKTETPTERLSGADAEEITLTEVPQEAQAADEKSVDVLCLVASGRRVYAIDPLQQKDLENLPLNLGFDEGHLGSLRSVRLAGDGRDRLCLAGARNGVYSMLLAHQKAAREYPIGNNVDARTGINAAILFKGFIYATHSEFGVLRWPVLQPYSPATQVMPEMTSRFSTTRGLTLYDDRMLFANGPSVMLLEAGPAGGASLRVAARYPGTRHEITALTHDGQYVLVADAAGDVYVWEPKKGTPPLLAFRAGSAVGELAATTLPGNRKCLLVALKRTVMPMLFQDGGTALEFVAPEPIRSCDVLEGVVIGLSRDRMRIFAWHENKPDWPQWQFQLAEPVLDMRLITPREISAGSSGRNTVIKDVAPAIPDESNDQLRYNPVKRPPAY